MASSSLQYGKRYIQRSYRCMGKLRMYAPLERCHNKGWSANKLYAEASQELDSGSYKTAIEYYEKLEARYPFGRYAICDMMYCASSPSSAATGSCLRKISVGIVPCLSVASTMRRRFSPRP